MGELKGVVLRKGRGKEKLCILVFLCLTTVLTHFSFFMDCNGKVDVGVG